MRALHNADLRGIKFHAQIEYSPFRLESMRVFVLFFFVLFLLKQLKHFSFKILARKHPLPVQGRSPNKDH